MEWIPKPRAAAKGDAEYGQHNNIILPRINWGRGRLQRFESLGAFTAKFCALNDISGKVCRSFFTEVTAQNNWWLDGFDGQALMMAAQILDEPDPIVGSLSGKDLELSACYGQFSFAHYKAPHASLLSYCPECLALGYHALFHEFSWLKQCPIHSIDLIRTNISVGIGSGRFDSYVRALWDVFDGDTGRWLSIRDQHIIEGLLSSQNFQNFRNWLFSARRLSECKQKNNVIAFHGGGYRDQDLGVLLGRLEWTAPIPDDIRPIFMMSSLRQKPIITQYSANAVRKLRDLLRKIPGQMYWSFFRRTRILNRETTPARKSVNDAIKKFQKLEARKKIKWGWLRRTGWVEVDPNGWPYWQVIKPSEAFIRWLRYKWLDFIEDDPPQRQTSNDWYLYREWAKLFQRHGLVEPLHKHLLDSGNLRVAARIQPLVKFLIDPEVIELSEFLLHQEACADVADAQYWLEGIGNDLTPYELQRTTAASNGNLFIEGESAYSIVWPRIRNISGDNEYDEVELDRSQFGFFSSTLSFTVGD